ncbi:MULTISPECIES: hypothetical protein [Kitasatospora]|uniref:Uncharacterized protein n=1 Tax=Kitasatospora setae (strain ATCC 33774 / DSM 43861 / JCM 3304 / KCC A-0304 / NBRC 14216 / KM-6054) TaxID=452652 RepID=E4N8F7_KITSK|nr:MULTISPECIES: hypothetical protein [Kitasatospora]BAJ27488.1 hypothetical protein KSE_16630 [Kitasatospora setae KM-6054]
MAAVLAASALALTACEPDGSAPAATAAATTGVPAAATSPAAASKPAAGGTGKSTAAATGKASKPAADCTADAAGRTVVEATENAYAVHVWMRAKSAKFVCGPDVPNDGYWEAQGAARLYEFDNDVKTMLLDDKLQAKSVDLFVFMKAQEACLKNAEPAAPYRCFGNQYEIKVGGAQNKIVSITQLYHP